MKFIERDLFKIENDLNNDVNAHTIERNTVHNIFFNESVFIILRSVFNQIYNDRSTITPVRNLLQISGPKMHGVTICTPVQRCRS